MKKLLTFLTLLLMLGGVARAEKKEWSIIKSDDSKSITAIFNGEITWGDTITLLLEKKNGSCDTVKKYIFLYSTLKNQNIVNLKGPFSPVETNLEISRKYFLFFLYRFESVLSHTEKLCLASYYYQLSKNIKMYNHNKIKTIFFPEAKNIYYKINFFYIW